MAETVKQALDAKRQELNGKVFGLFLCKNELFYSLEDGMVQDTIYPVSLDIATKEAKFFKCKVSEQ